MSLVTPTRIKIFLALTASLAISFSLIDSLFITRTSTPHWQTLNTKIATLKDSVANQGARLTSLFITMNIDRIIPTPEITPLPTLFIPSPQPSAVPPPLSTPIPSPTFSLFPSWTPYPTAVKMPTSTPYPTQIPRVPSATKAPDLTPTRPPKPTSAPDPEGVPTFKDPLSQKWYGNGSLACYTQERFVHVYANGITPDSCRTNVKNSIASQTISVHLLGRSITVHKKAAAAFQAVANRLEQYKKDATHYDFPSKSNYEIRNVGAYIFRCNVNASTSDKFDTCSTGCVLSPHSFGIAVDINYDTNANGSKNYDMPKEVVDTFEYFGFRWGGNYPKIGSTIDAMHFEYMAQLCDGV